jgi:predicted SAM-dependent methyltransferase
MLPLKLNLGCGSNKIPGCVNIDIEESNNPDLVADFTKALPYDTSSVDAVYMFHVIEHVKKALHEAIFYEVARVLKPDCFFYLSYPEFLTCVKCYQENLYGKRDFWEATIYGRQLYPADTHVALMDTKYVTTKLTRVGFKDLVVASEPDEFWNTTIKAKKGSFLSHEQAAKINFNF